MSNFLPARWLAGLSALAALSAGAQTVSTPAAAQTAGSTPTLPFHSAMEGYTPLADEKAIPWNEANETVYRRGGWRAYANEAAGTADTRPSQGAGPHAGHTMPMAPRKENP